MCHSDFDGCPFILYLFTIISDEYHKRRYYCQSISFTLNLYNLIEKLTKRKYLKRNEKEMILSNPDKLTDSKKRKKTKRKESKKQRNDK